MTEDQFKATNKIQDSIKALNEAVIEGFNIGVQTELGLDGPQFGRAKTLASATFQYQDRPIPPKPSFE